ncbi:Hypothetical predicted protein, partial [Olea europaea subsp. europaea]
TVTSIDRRLGVVGFCEQHTGYTIGEYLILRHSLDRGVTYPWITMRLPILTGTPGIQYVYMSDIQRSAQARDKGKAGATDPTCSGPGAHSRHIAPHPTTHTGYRGTVANSLVMGILVLSKDRIISFRVTEKSSSSNSFI